MNELRTRPAVPDGLDGVPAFWRTAAEGTSISDDRAGVERLAARDARALILAERGGEPVGTVIAGFDGWRCHPYRLAVAPGRRHQGIATAARTPPARFAPASAAGYGPEEQWRRWVKPLTG
ncbi:MULTISPECIES: GNAT family N-acetyltransferase [unclassified Streptomyces]|uniref:GNAT family N-acetyltransferase n=1 Tax=unclassified Streptomyces TaxID=2593676 RepID=UPI00131852E2|nr:MULTISPECIES: GNAT family N-acetyltransferase [unclassified Streptomyces]QHC28354.1 GNAT family N-acetyltransferase [Streptomyces sp. HF10]WKE72922.1 GNAT family N-acetyltransferase [Streptomyces sp. WP-1]